LRRRALHWVRRIRYIGRRIRHHALSLPQTAISGLRWWRRTRAL
jgi:hypothetical protein